MGDQSSRSRIYNDYARKVIRVKALQLVKRPELTGENREDIEQRLALHLVSQAHHFDERRASLNTFIARVIDSAVAMLLRAKRAAKRAAERDVRSLDSAVPEEASSSAEGQTDVTALDDLEDAERREQLREAVDELPGRLRRVWERLLVGTPTSTARDLNISRQQVRNLMEEIRKHFEQRGLDDF